MARESHGQTFVFGFHLLTWLSEFLWGTQDSGSKENDTDSKDDSKEKDSDSKDNSTDDSKEKDSEASDKVRSFTLINIYSTSTMKYVPPLEYVPPLVLTRMTEILTSLIPMNPLHLNPMMTVRTRMVVMM
jgi:hypothetical protein